MTQYQEEFVRIPVGSVLLEGTLGIPNGAKGIVLFAHGSGSSRRSPRNVFVANALRGARLGTLLVDLLTEEEDYVTSTRFDIDLLSHRLISITNWLMQEPKSEEYAVGYFGASTGAAAALKAAVHFGDEIASVVSRGGRPDMAAADLKKVRAPTLLIVGGNDETVIELNRYAYDQLTAPKEMVIVPGATHLFEEPGALEEVARLARDWFTRCFDRLQMPVEDHGRAVDDLEDEELDQEATLRR